MNYDYEKQLDEIENYLRKREKNQDDFRIGVEFEHFIIDKTSFETISYWDENGVRATLEELEARGWKASYEGDYILGVEKGDKVVSLEPGSQFEFSIKAKSNIEELMREYREFMEEISQILDEKNQVLVALGYHPKTKIEDIKILPKDRYDYMFNYFKDKGAYAHNMMKGTASLQVSLDYSNEEDYRKKVKLANAIAPIMYGICDNGYYFQGEKFDKKSLRTLIWTNMDDDRSGTVPGSLDDNFSYRAYGDYVLGVPPILIMDGQKAIATHDKKMAQLFNPEDYRLEDLEHMMTMVFPDVRTKGFIEIRMMDSISYPYNFGVVALLKGIFYSQENIDFLYEKFKDLDYEDIILGKENIIKHGLEGQYYGKSVGDWGRELAQLAQASLDPAEREILKPFKELLDQGKNPYMLLDAAETYDIQLMAADKLKGRR